MKPTEFESFMNEVALEISSARNKFPSNKHLGLAFAEEAGELVKAVLDYEQKGGTKSQVRKEAIQACAMAFRLLMEGSEELVYQGVDNDKK